MFNEHSPDAITVERSLHEGFLKDLGVAQDEADRTAPTPTTLAYSSYLLKTVSLADYPEVLGAVLPCYWIYWEIGKALLERGSPNPMYQKWIDTYGGEEFGALVEAVLDLTDEVCKDLNPTHKARVRDAFVVTSRYEWMSYRGADHPRHHRAHRGHHRRAGAPPDHYGPLGGRPAYADPA